MIHMHKQATVSCVGLMSAISSASGHSDAVTCMTGPLKQEGDPTVSFTFTLTFCCLALRTNATTPVVGKRLSVLHALMKSSTAGAYSTYTTLLPAKLLLPSVITRYVISCTAESKLHIAHLRPW
jgi:hypothetical protein